MLRFSDGIVKYFPNITLAQAAIGLNILNRNIVLEILFNIR